MTDELNDQAETQSDNEQSEVEESSVEDQVEQEQSKIEETVEIDGEKISLEELKKGYMRQKDYTKKTQEISALKKQAELPPDKQAILSELKNLGVMTKDEFQREQAIELQMAG